MSDYITKAIDWIKNNVLYAVVILLGIIILFFPKMLGGMFRSPRRRRRTIPRSVGRRRRTIPRSVGMKRRNKPAVRRSGKAKKPWQIKGSPAARRRMAQIRRMR